MNVSEGDRRPASGGRSGSQTVSVRWSETGLTGGERTALLSHTSVVAVPSRSVGYRCPRVPTIRAVGVLVDRKTGQLKLYTRVTRTQSRPTFELVEVVVARVHSCRTVQTTG